MYIVDRLAPGATIRRRLGVTNTTGSTAHVAVYIAAASVQDGSFLPGSGQSQNELSTWSAAQPQAIDVPAGGDAVATVTVAVPTGVSPGERYAVIWAEVRSTPTTASGVVEVSRVGIRMYVSVGPGGAPAPDFAVDGLQARRLPDGQPELLAAVHNTGGRALDMTGTVTLHNGPGGLSAGPFPAVLGATLGVGASSPVTIGLDRQLPLGPWDVRITVKSGALERVVEGRLSFPATSSAPAISATALRPFWLSPVLGAGGAALLSLTVWGLRRWRRRVRPTPELQTASV